MALSLPPLPAGQPIATKDGQPTLAFTVYWQQLLEALSGAINEISDNVAAIQAAMDAAAAAQSTADTATVIASARQPDVPPITITADSSGAVSPTNQLPRNVAFKRYQLAVDVTTSATWSASLKSGAATFSIGSATGILNITALAASSTIEVQSARNGVNLTTLLVINKNNAAASGGSGGGSSATDSSFDPFSSTTFAVVSNELTVVAGAGGNVTLTAADLSVSTAAEAPTGMFAVHGKWEWDSTGGGAWVDVGSEAISSLSAEVTDLGGEYGMTTGLLTNNQVKTGLTPSTSHKFRFMARNDSGTRVMDLAGTISAVGS